MKFTVSFLGAGNMGEAMIKGLVSSGLSPGNILAYDAVPQRLSYIAGVYKVKKAGGVSEAMKADAVVVAVKPQSIDALLEEMAGEGGNLPLVISIAAGVKVDKFSSIIGNKARIIRVMPNTPSLIGKGVSCYYVGDKVKASDVKIAQAILSSLGPSFRVDKEDLLNAVTGLSGSGPAFVYMMIEALADGGVLMGLPRDLSLALAANTVMGAASMVLETGEHPGSLKDKVASPGGTTIAGIAELEDAGVRSAFIGAVREAALRSRQLGEK